MKDASVENIDTPQCRTEPTSKDFNNSTEREHHLHQIFITKNRVLCDLRVTICDACGDIG
jgi:hypothetical protein